MHKLECTVGNSWCLGKHHLFGLSFNRPIAFNAHLIRLECGCRWACTSMQLIWLPQRLIWKCHTYRYHTHIKILINNRAPCFACTAGTIKGSGNVATGTSLLQNKTVAAIQGKAELRITVDSIDQVLPWSFRSKFLVPIIYSDVLPKEKQDRYNNLSSTPAPENPPPAGRCFCTTTPCENLHDAMRQHNLHWLGVKEPALLDALSRNIESYYWS